MRTDMRSYTHVLNLFGLRGDNLFSLLKEAEDAFKDDPAVTLKLNRERHSIELLFDDSLTVEDCESIYKRLFDVKPVGVILHTNRFELFEIYDENYAKVSKLQEKMFKQKAKFDKAKRKLEKALEKIQ